MRKLESSPYSKGRQSKATPGAAKGDKAARPQTSGQVNRELFEGHCDSLQKELADIQRKRNLAERVRGDIINYNL